MKNICPSKKGGRIVGLPTEGMPRAIRFALAESPVSCAPDRLLTRTIRLMVPYR